MSRRVFFQSSLNRLAQGEGVPPLPWANYIQNNNKYLSNQ